MTAGRLRYLQSGEKGPKTPAFRLVFEGGARARAHRGRREEARGRLAADAGGGGGGARAPRARRRSASARSGSAEICAAESRRLHSMLRDQRVIAGHRPRVGERDPPPRAALAVRARHATSRRRRSSGSRTRSTRSSTRGLELRERGANDKKTYRVHNKLGEPCYVCGTPIAQVDFEEHTIYYCPECQTGGRVLKDRRLSRCCAERPCCRPSTAAIETDSDELAHGRADARRLRSRRLRPDGAPPRAAGRGSVARECVRRRRLPSARARVFLRPRGRARLLLERGADVNALARNEHIRTAAIHAAAAAGGTGSDESTRYELVRLVLEHAADPNLRQGGGFRAIDAARQNEDTRVEAPAARARRDDLAASSSQASSNPRRAAAAHRERHVREQPPHLRRVVVLHRGFELLARRASAAGVGGAASAGGSPALRGSLRQLDRQRLAVERDRAAERRTTITATAAPRSRRSSPSTTGADEAVIGESVSVAPSTRSSTCSSPPCRSAHCTSAETAALRSPPGRRAPRRPSPQTRDALLAEPLRRGRGELERVGRLQRSARSGRSRSARRARARRAARRAAATPPRSSPCSRCFGSPRSPIRMIVRAKP